MLRRNKKMTELKFLLKFGKREHLESLVKAIFIVLTPSLSGGLKIN